MRLDSIQPRHVGTTIHSLSDILHQVMAAERLPSCNLSQHSTSTTLQTVTHLINIDEDREVVQKVYAFLQTLHPYSIALPEVDDNDVRTIASECDQASALPTFSRISWLRPKQRQSAQAAALLQLPMVDRVYDDVKMIQITPKRFHASSGFSRPAWAEEFGIKSEDWRAFTTQFSRANSASNRQMLISGIITTLFEACMLWTIPILGVSGATATSLLALMYAKRYNLKQRMRDGSIPAWTAYWNATYFGPKGLVVGFDLPGPVFAHVAVAPKRRWLR